MTVLKPHLPSLFWIWHPGLKFVVLSAAEGHCCEVLNSWFSKAIAKGWEQPCCCFWAVGCWPSGHWHHFAPTARLCRCYWVVFGPRTKDGHFWNKNEVEECMVPAHLHLHWLLWRWHSGWTDPWAGPCSLHKPHLDRISQFPLFRPKASISEIVLNH